MSSLSDQIVLYGLELEALWAYLSCVRSATINGKGLRRLIQNRNTMARNLSAIYDIPELNQCANEPIPETDKWTTLTQASVQDHLRLAREAYIRAVKIKEDRFEE